MQVQATLPARLYVGEAHFAIEKETLLAKSWRLAAHQSMLVRAGDYVADLVAGRPIVIVRDEAGGLNAFHNVCRHRAGPLVTDEAGRCEREFVCAYHGWRYALDGRLRGATDFGAADGFDSRAFGLFPLKLETWRGFVFVNCDLSAPPLAEAIAPLEAIWAERNFALQPFALRRRHDIACNWKTYVENYLEGYHVPRVHPALNAEIEAGAYRVEMRGPIAIHHAPSKAPGGVYDGLWAWMWPDLGVNVYRHGVMMERITPLSAGMTRLDYLYFYDPARREDLEATLAMSDAVTAEDKDICERVQANLNAGVYEQGVLSPKHEGAVAWFQARIAEAHA